MLGIKGLQKKTSLPLSPQPRLSKKPVKLQIIKNRPMPVSKQDTTTQIACVTEISENDDKSVQTLENINSQYTQNLASHDIDTLKYLEVPQVNISRCVSRGYPLNALNTTRTHLEKFDPFDQSLVVSKVFEGEECVLPTITSPVPVHDIDSRNSGHMYNRRRASRQLPRTEDISVATIGTDRQIELINNIFATLKKPQPVLKARRQSLLNFMSSSNSPKNDRRPPFDHL